MFVFDGYFGPASETMRKFFDEYLVCARQMGEASKFSKTIFPKSKLERWMGYCNTALEQINSLKGADATRYNQLEKNIKCEMISPRYLLIRLYRIDGGQEITDLQVVTEQFIQDCMAVGVQSMYQKHSEDINDVDLSYVG